MILFIRPTNLRGKKQPRGWLINCAPGEIGFRLRKATPDKRSIVLPARRSSQSVDGKGRI
jgi:hypothetical protein